LALPEPHQLPASSRTIDANDRYLAGVDQVVARVANDRQVAVVVGTPRIATWYDVMDVDRRRLGIAANLTPVLDQPLLTGPSPHAPDNNSEPIDSSIKEKQS
jgi:hypothetical protein